MNYHTRFICFPLFAYILILLVRQKEQKMFLPLQYDENCFYDSKTYLHMPSTLSKMANHTIAGSDRLVRNSKDAFYIKTIVCSTKLTQNGKSL